LMMRGQGQLDTGAVPGLRDEFATLRESLTAHAMSLDENMKALGSRLTAIENKVNEKDPQSIRLGE
jgi:hypothetical protein